ncbi:hypothetical protein MSEO_20040 [Mycobacterium seoulense]|uniref:Uncharacterized protein n=1 Tax=Mycobacterium seoulense TaxID=386911 RepID=A0A7I7NYE4_9MYCO|nr:hypothetical protein MSEO_20040 [Mycobacterium seoulense]
MRSASCEVQLADIPLQEWPLRGPKHRCSRWKASVADAWRCHVDGSVHPESAAGPSLDLVHIKVLKSSLVKRKSKAAAASEEFDARSHEAVASTPQPTTRESHSHAIKLPLWDDTIPQPEASVSGVVL